MIEERKKKRKVNKRNKKEKKRKEKKPTAAELKAGQSAALSVAFAAGPGLKRKSKDTRGYERIKV